MTSVHQAHSCVKLWMTLFLPEACIESSSTIRASHHGGIFWVSTILVSPCPVTNVCAVLNNRVLSELSHIDHVHPRSQRLPDKKTSDKREILPLDRQSGVSKRPLKQGRLFLLLLVPHWKHLAYTDVTHPTLSFRALPLSPHCGTLNFSPSIEGTITRVAQESSKGCDSSLLELVLLMYTRAYTILSPLLGV